MGKFQNRAREAENTQSQFIEILIRKKKDFISTPILSKGVSNKKELIWFKIMPTLYSQVNGGWVVWLAEFLVADGKH